MICNLLTNRKLQQFSVFLLLQKLLAIMLIILDRYMYVCMLDASKAFDYVNLLLLFMKLLQRDMCPLFLRFLMNTYCKQQMRVKWNGTISNTFSTSNGVK